MNRLRHNNAKPSSRKTVRRGSLYVPILGTCFILSLMVIAGLHSVRGHVNATSAQSDLFQGRLLAQSAIEYAMAQLNGDPNWLTSYTVDTKYPATPVAVGEGSFQWRLLNDGGLRRRLQGIGTVGKATCVCEVTLIQSPALDCALLAGGDITVSSGSKLAAEEGPICSNGEFTNAGATQADVEAQSIQGSSIDGNAVAPGTLRVLPSPSYVLDYYSKLGTTIAPAVTNGVTVISYQLLSPTESLGENNADGIYIIDTQGNDLTIQFSRIVGTVVVTNLAADKKVYLKGDINWEPAHPNYPALVVDGDLVIQMNHDGILEEGPTTPNYNPSGTPYQGSSDLLHTDDYISSIAGLIYCTGDLIISGDEQQDPTPDLRGPIIAGKNCTLSSNTSPTISYLDDFAKTPPPGFNVESDVAILPGSWRWVESD